MGNGTENWSFFVCYHPKMGFNDLELETYLFVWCTVCCTRMIIHFRVSPFGATFGCKPCWELNFQDFHGPHMKTNAKHGHGVCLALIIFPISSQFVHKMSMIWGPKNPPKNNFQTHPYKVNRSPKLRTWFQHCRKKMVKSFVLDSLDFNQVTPM